MHIIAVSNLKGGVGKTTSAVNVGAGLARAGFRTVVVDLDPQVNLTRALLGAVQPAENVYGALLAEYPVKIYATPAPGLFLIAGSASLSAFEKVKGDEMDREFLLQSLVEPLRTYFDYLVLDCPPNLGLLTLNAYTCANYLLIPVEAQLFSTEGLDRALDLLSKVQRRLNPGLQVIGIFLTRYDRRKILRRETAEELRARYPQWMMQTVVRESIALGEAPHAGQDIFSYALHSAGAADYHALTTELLARQATPLTA